ncbi:uncharacterized protein EI90DRAFT_3059515 [Cantharellus anzutake]|uniref:uncharacterized protein n=1 Tax=Cantharellus anzutake TaxID=1750568 RepID=UPI001905B9EF|nr:uncharacterized protein EI90DRAFT_3059515 [Cantharellus anzutake]KAF8330852.1 hypothetical protein EI90DRAFT_3059515 [Cantharellus anzutake]
MGILVKENGLGSNAVRWQAPLFHFLLTQEVKRINVHLPARAQHWPQSHPLWTCSQ